MYNIIPTDCTADEELNLVNNTNHSNNSKGPNGVPKYLSCFTFHCIGSQPDTGYVSAFLPKIPNARGFSRIGIIYGIIGAG